MTLAILVDLLPITCMLCRYETVVAALVQRMFYKVRARVVRGVKYSTWWSRRLDRTFGQGYCLDS